MIQEALYGWDEHYAGRDRLSELPADFTGPLLQGMLEGIPEKQDIPWRRNRCRFHEHLTDDDDSVRRTLIQSLADKKLEVKKDKSRAMTPVLAPNASPSGQVRTTGRRTGAHSKR